MLKPDVSLIGPETASPPLESEALALVQEELTQYAQYDQEDEDAYEHRVREAFLARELRQIDVIIESRKTYANKIFLLVVCWLASIGIILLLTGFRLGGFALDNNVLLALIGGTTLNVLGIFTIVANFLFPKNGHSIFSRSKPEGNALKKRTPNRGAARAPKLPAKATSDETTVE